MSFSKLFLSVTRNYCKGMYRQNPCLISEASYSAFLNAWPRILDDSLKFNALPAEAAERLIKVADHVVLDGKKVRGTLALHAFETIKDNVSEDLLHQMRVLAWGTEIVHSYFIILDDLQDGGMVRRGKPCWHVLPDVRQQAANDASMLRSFLCKILRENFYGQPSWHGLRQLFDDAFLFTSIGQHMDSMTTKTTSNNYHNFTMDRYNNIVKYKTSYLLKLPIYLAMTLSGNQDLQSFQYVDNICNDIGILMQMKNDYVDCFDDGCGHYGTDIQEGKCTWLAVSALQRCSAPQRIVFAACYGSHEPAHIERTQQLYIKLDLPKLYKEEAQAMSDQIVRKANALSVNASVSPQLFLNLHDVIVGR